MFPSPYLLMLLAQFTQTPPAPSHDRAQVTQAAEQGQLSWADAEDRITGNFSPLVPEAGQALEVVVRVGNLQGPPFEGPVTLALSPQKGGGGKSQTVSMMPGPKAWAAKLETGEPGAYWLEIGFNTGRHKVVRAEVTVGEARLPRWPWYVLIGVVAVAALALGVRSVIGKKT